MRGVTSATEQFLQDLSRIQRRMDRAQRQLTTGIRLSSVADDPDQVSTLLQRRADLHAASQTRDNLQRVKLEVDTAEQTLQEAIKLVEQARTLGTRGGGTYQEAGTRTQIAAELQSILERLVGLSARQVEGRYLFSGDKDMVAPYALDPLAPAGVSAYQGSASTRRIPDAEGTLLAIAKSADEIFDSSTAENNVFLAVNNLRRALLAMDTPPDPPDPTIPSIEQAIDNVGTALKHLNGQLYFYGITQTRITASINHAVELETSYRSQVAEIQEADLAEAASEFTQSKLALDAALTAKAQTTTKSLFNYLA